MLHLFNASVIHLAYRLALEHPLLSTIGDAVASYKSLMKEHLSPSKMVLMDDSADGGLSLLTIQRLISKQISVSRRVIVMSPWTDLSSLGKSYVRNCLTDVMLIPKLISWIAKNVIESFPSMYVIVGTAKLAKDDARQGVDKAIQTGVNVTLEEDRHLSHAYPIVYLYYSEACKTLENIQESIEHLYQ